MAGLPKKYAKMGFAKGWRAYKASKRKSSSRARSGTKKRRVRTMARRRKKSYSRRSSRGFMGGVSKEFMGAAGVVAYESLLSPMIPVQGTARDVVELLGGAYLAKKSGWVGATGKTLVTLNAYQLLRRLIDGQISAGTSSVSNGSVIG